MKQICTSCKDCKFSIYDGKTQVGCEFNLINKYINAGINVVEAYDEEKEFYVINRICVYSRHKSHAHSKEDVIKSSKIRYQIIYILSDTNIDDFLLCLNSLLNQDIKPIHITVVKPYHIDIQPFKITKLLARSGIQWRYQECVDSDFKEYDLIDSCIDQVSYPYYIIIRNNEPLHNDLSKQLDDLVNDKFKVFSNIKLDDNNEIYTTVYHKQLGGNAFQPLLEKILNEEQLKSTIYTWNQLSN
jgi:hypothetical protein